MKKVKLFDKREWKDYLEMFIFSCFVGFVCEFIVGWSIFLFIGEFLWIYPESFLKTTSFWVIPLWGLGGIIGLFLWKLVRKYDIL